MSGALQYPNCRVTSAFYAAADCINRAVTVNNSIAALQEVETDISLSHFIASVNAGFATEKDTLRAYSFVRLRRHILSRILRLYFASSLIKATVFSLTNYSTGGIILYVIIASCLRS